jgi:DNA-binding response OmpR family regulator
MSRNKQRILIIEDDKDLNSLLKYTLETTGDFDVRSHFEGERALEAIQQFTPDLVILDVMLPGAYGTDILRKVRFIESLQHILVVLLTARSQEKDKVDGFEAGADDYITKPFSPKELLLRVQALLRRLGTGAPKHLTVESESLVMQLGVIQIYPKDFKVLIHKKPVSLTATEFQLLLFLAERVGNLQSRETLLKNVWKSDAQVNSRTVDTHIKRLRQKLGTAGSLIETVHGLGYSLIIK